MKKVNLTFPQGFKVVAGNSHSQAATMVIPVGGKEGGPDNNHRGADQWLFVISGQGAAMIDGRKYRLRPATLILIEKGRNHEIRNLGATPLVTLNFYLPPAYTAGGEERPAAQAKKAPKQKGCIDRIKGCPDQLII